MDNANVIVVVFMIYEGENPPPNDGDMHGWNGVTEVGN